MRHAMRLPFTILLWVLFVIGALLGVVIGALVFPVSLLRRARAVHFDGVICRAELIAHTSHAERLTGSALVRLSGALADQATTGSDVLGLDIRMQRVPRDDAAYGDQDLLLGTFESFRTVIADKARTSAGDYLANHYSTVTPWYVPDLGPVILRLAPPPPPPPDAARGTTRLDRLDADIAADRARLEMTVDYPYRGIIRRRFAALRLVERLSLDQRALRTSMLRQGRGVRPLGLRNGIRLTVYPLSQLARRLRGG